MQASECQQPEVDGTSPVDLGSLAFKPTMRTLALKVPDDSLIERHILPGDIIVLEHALKPRSGDLISAYVGGVPILRYYRVDQGKAYLRAMNPKYPAVISAADLVILGVATMLIRKVVE